MRKETVISEVAKGSLAEEIGVKRGDTLLSINGQKVRDVIDYQVMTDDREFRVEVLQTSDSSLRPWRISYDIYKKSGEPFGLKFKTSIFDKVKTCTNRCVFCFIDQLPQSLRKSLYLKDDDFRLSFLYGNFITLTNACDEDMSRMVNQRLSPLYVSLHATDPAVRKVMIKPRGEDKALYYLKCLLDAGIEVHLQVVVCPGLNDKDTLSKTIRDLESEFSRVASIGIVPVGLTCYRKGLTPLRSFTLKEATTIIEEISPWQEKFTKAKGTPWIFLADEFYLRSGVALPLKSHYQSFDISQGEDDACFSQLENGIGLATLFIAEVKNALKETSFSRAKRARFTILTGGLSYLVVVEVTKKIQLASGNKISFDILPVPNSFFGREVTVTGLLTGKEVLTFLENRNVSGTVLIPDILVDSQGLFLDDVSARELTERLPHRVEFVPSTGRSFVKKIEELAL